MDLHFPESDKLFVPDSHITKLHQHHSDGPPDQDREGESERERERERKMRKRKKE